MPNVVQVNTADLVTSREAMEILNYASPSSIARLVYSGRLIPVHQIGGTNGSYLFDRADIERIAAARTSIGALIESAALSTITVILERRAS